MNSLPSTNDPAAARTAQHLQKCLTALEQIRGIAGEQSTISKIALTAMHDRPVNAGGTPLDG